MPTIMQRILVSAALLLTIVECAQAQTTVNITMPNSSTCTYTTGPVTSNPIVPGQLQATASGSSGAGCGSSAGSVSFGPASPLAPASQTLGNGGGAANLTFQAVNATQCTGSITGATGGTFTNGTTLCSGAACSSAVSVPATFPANSSQTTDNVYTITATCTGAGSSQATSAATVTVSHNIIQTVGACPRVITNSAGGSFNSPATGAKLPINYVRSTNGGTRLVDTSLFSNIYEIAWPGNYNDNVQISLPTNEYISAQFTTPQNFFNPSQTNFPANLYGEYAVQESAFSAAFSMTISTNCGDFSAPGGGSSVVAGCRVINANNNSPSFMSWTDTGSCILTGGSTYYLNIINANVSNVTPTGGTATSTANARCLGSVCIDPLLNGPGTWSFWNGTIYTQPHP
jgi:hypothetical protein